MNPPGQLITEALHTIFLFIYLKYVLKVLPVSLFMAFDDFVYVQYIE